MKVSLKSITPNAEELIMYTARVSNPSNQNSGDTKLIDYCIRNKHWSIFEQAHMTVEIETSIPIAMQLIRHHSFRFQQISRRYTSERISFEPVELRWQGGTKQGSGDTVDNPHLDALVEECLSVCENAYYEMITSGVSRETARFILPQTTSSRLYMVGDIRSWIHYLQVRTGEHTQKEHRLVANKVWDIFISNLPNISTSLGWI